MNRLSEIFTPTQISIKEEDLEAYATETQKPVAVIWPNDDEQLRQLFRYVSRTDTPLFIRGNNTHSRVKEIIPGTLILDLSQKNKILKLNLKEKTVVVEAGVMISDLNEFLLDYGLEFPIRVSNKSSTIGGSIATNAITTRSILYPNIQEWIEELTIVDGTGKYYTSKTIKDFVGSEGTIGCILQAKLKLTTPIEKTRIQTYFFDHSLDLLEKTQSLKKDPSLISIQMLDKTSTALLNLQEQYLLLAEFKDSSDTEAESFNHWKKFKGMHSNLCQKGYDDLEDVFVPLPNLSKILVWLRKNNIPAKINLDQEVVYPYFRRNQKTQKTELYKLVVKNQGKVNGAYGIGTQKKEYISTEKKEELKELKQIYDPDFTLNRGIIL